MAEREEQDSGMPAVGKAGLGYALPPRADGMIYARPVIITSVESTRQLVSGHVFTEPGDAEPIGDKRHEGQYFIRDAKMGNPAEPGTCHWLAKNYTGRSDGPGLTTEAGGVAQDVSEPGNAPQGSTAPASAPVAAQEAWQRLGFASRAAWREAGKPQG